MSAQRFLLLLAAFSLAAAQVMGVHRGYVCLMGHEARETVADHCHPHDHGLGSDHEEHDRCPGGESHPHAPAKVDLQVPPASLATLTVPAVSACVLPTLEAPVEAFLRELSSLEAQRVLGRIATAPPPTLRAPVSTDLVLLV